MKWPYEGKYKGEDVNDLDEGYLNWCIENADRNAERADTAEKILDFRSRHSDKSNTHSEKKTSNYSAPKLTAEVRLKVLRLALDTSLENPWQYIDDYERYVMSGRRPPNESHIIGDDFEE